MKSRKIRNAVLIASMMIVVSGAVLVGVRAQIRDRPEKKTVMTSTIAFVSTRHVAVPAEPPLVDTQIYLMNGDGTNVRRLTENKHTDNFPALSPDGRRIVFESNRLRAEGEPANISHLFLMNTDGTSQTPLVPGSSATWSPDGKRIAFHNSASGKGELISGLPGAASNDSDIFILNVDDFLSKKSPARNITNNPDTVDDDPDWSPDGKKIAFTSHSVTDDQTNSVTAEIYVLDGGGKGKPRRLTNNKEEERAPDWSPDGKLIAYSCRKGEVVEGRLFGTFEICIMNADGSGQKRITNNRVPELTVSWLPDGKRLMFQRAVGGRGMFQLFIINADGTGERQITTTPGLNGFANWGEILSPSKAR